MTRYCISCNNKVINRGNYKVEYGVIKPINLWYRKGDVNGVICKPCHDKLTSSKLSKAVYQTDKSKNGILLLETNDWGWDFNSVNFSIFKNFVPQDQIYFKKIINTNILIKTIKENSHNFKFIFINTHGENNNILINDEMEHTESIVETVEEYHQECQWLHLGCCQGFDREVIEKKTQMIVTGYKFHIDMGFAMAIESYFLFKLLVNKSFSNLTFEDVKFERNNDPDNFEKIYYIQ